MQSVGVNQGIGCLAILPAALIGFVGLTDGIGPKVGAVLPSCSAGS